MTLSKTFRKMALVAGTKIERCRERQMVGKPALGWCSKPYGLPHTNSGIINGDRHKSEQSRNWIDCERKEERRL